MNLQQHENRDDMKIWLSQNEVEQLLEAADDTNSGSRSRSGHDAASAHTESLNVAPEDIVDTDAGTMLRVWHGKGDKFRETPVPRDLATTIRTVDDVRDAPTSGRSSRSRVHGHLAVGAIGGRPAVRRDWRRRLGSPRLPRSPTDPATALASDDVDPLQPVTGVGGTTRDLPRALSGELQSRGSATRTPESELALSERSLHMPD